MEHALARTSKTLAAGAKRKRLVEVLSPKDPSARRRTEGLIRARPPTAQKAPKIVTSLRPHTSSSTSLTTRQPRDEIANPLTDEARGEPPLKDDSKSPKVPPMPTAEAHPSTTKRARVFSFIALGALLTTLGYVGFSVYRAATDAFVAPAILSSESDLVIQTKAKMAELEVERGRIEAEAAAIDANLEASDRAITRLKTLRETLATSLDWRKSENSHKAASTQSELRSLERQRAVLLAMLSRQSRIVNDASTDLNAHFISKADEAKERLSLDQVQLALLENERARLQAEATLSATFVAQRSLAASDSAVGTRSEVMLMPEAVAREEHLVQIELEISRLESEQRKERTEKKVVLAKLAKMDELETQLRMRPLFRATQQSLEVAFVPYTQSDSVSEGAVVYDCLWSIFNCKAVGTVTEMIPGEVILPDPWGNQARGQYAVLGLHRHESAKSKVLRVRGGTPRPTPSTNGPVVSTR